MGTLTNEELLELGFDEAISGMWEYHIQRTRFEPRTYIEYYEDGTWFVDRENYSFQFFPESVSDVMKMINMLTEYKIDW